MTRIETGQSSSTDWMYPKRNISLKEIFAESYHFLTKPKPTFVGRRLKIDRESMNDHSVDYDRVGPRSERMFWLGGYMVWVLIIVFILYLMGMMYRIRRKQQREQEIRRAHAIKHGLLTSPDAMVNTFASFRL